MSFRKRLGIILLAGALFASGCYYPIKRSEKHPSPESIYTEVGVRAGADITRIDFGLSREKRTVPVHPDDGVHIGASRDGVTMNESYFVRPRLGVEWSRGTRDLRFKAGGDAKILAGQHDRKLQKAGGESYGYITSDHFTLSPFIGLDAKLYKDMGLGIELGIPFTRGEYEKGHYRYNRSESIAKYPWGDFGKSINVRLNSRDKSYFGHFKGFVYGFEQYDTRLGGEQTSIDIQSISLLFEF